jgi:ADP-ribose pyrophosphatase
MSSGAAPGQLATRRVHTGRVLNLDVDTVRYPDGSSGELEIIRHPGAAAVLPVLSAGDSADPHVLMIRQYRYAASGIVWEIPAGRLDPGETPEACARRELLEEAGCSAGRLEHLTTIYTTPGFTDERIHLYAAHEITAGDHAREVDEFLELSPQPLSTVLRMVKDGEIVDAKSIVTLLYFAGFRLGL